MLIYNAIELYYLELRYLELFLVDQKSSHLESTLVVFLNFIIRHETNTIYIQYT